MVDRRSALWLFLVLFFLTILPLEGSSSRVRRKAEVDLRVCLERITPQTFVSSLFQTPDPEREHLQGLDVHRQQLSVYCKVPHELLAQEPELVIELITLDAHTIRYQQKVARSSSTHHWIHDGGPQAKHKIVAYLVKLSCNGQTLIERRHHLYAPLLLESGTIENP